MFAVYGGNIIYIFALYAYGKLIFLSFNYNLSIHECKQYAQVMFVL